MKILFTGVLLLAVALTTGCFDTFTTMSPGETIELDEMTIGDEYVIDSCQVTRTAPGGVVLINASSLSIFVEADDDRDAAMRKYLNEPARAEGLVTGVTNYDLITADEVEILIGGFTVDGRLNTNLTAAQLNALIGNTVTIEGRVWAVWRDSIWLYDCSIVEP